MTSVQQLKTYSFLEDLIQNKAQVYLVGGCVLDEILGRDSKDFDLIVTGLPFKDLTSTLKKHGRLSLVGKSFGIIKFYPNEAKDLELDIALPRKEVSTGNKHQDFEVNFDHNLPLAEDLARRDFTINAIAQDLKTMEFIDPFNGQDDIQNKLIRTVFDNSFVEDPLRLLRAVQFSARLGFKIEENTYAQMKEHASRMEHISPERIMIEIKKLFMAPVPSEGFHIMRDTGILPYVFPDVQNMIGVTQPNKNNEDVYTHTMKVLDAARAATELNKPGDIDIMFSALFHDAGKPKTKRENDTGRVTFFNHQHISTGIAWRWMKDHKVRTIGVNPKKVCHLVKHHMFESKPFEGNDTALRRFINKVGPENVFDLLDLRIADKKGGRFPKKMYGILKLRERVEAELNKEAPFTPKDLALSGHDIMQMGFKPGPIIGAIQKDLMELVLDHPEKNTPDSLKEFIEENQKNYLTLQDELMAEIKAKKKKG